MLQKNHINIYINKYLKYLYIIYIYIYIYIYYISINYFYCMEYQFTAYVHANTPRRRYITTLTYNSTHI